MTIVTGARGFLGRRVADELEATGHDVVEVGRPDVEIPSRAFDELLERRAPEVLVHCAGPASVPGSFDDPVRDFQGSAGVTAAVLARAAAQRRPPRVVLVSSAAVYGQPPALPVGEDAALSPISPYGVHRVVCELLGREFHAVYGVGVAIVRVFSAYGEGLRRQVMWDVCRKALVDPIVRLVGTGEESRDFVHGVDVARAVRFVAEHGSFEGEAYNVGSGEETTIETLARLLLDGLGVSRPLQFSQERRRGDPERWRADISRISELGFATTVDLERGARAYARWVRAELRASA